MIIVIIIWAEDLNHNDDPFRVFYSFCAKTPFPLETVHKYIYIKLYILGTVLSHFVEFGVYIAILIKQSKIESSASSVYILKNNQCVSNRRHQRNMVSALGHFSSCIISIIITLTFVFPPIMIFLVGVPPNSRLISHFIAFSFPTINFFVYPLIETMCTENLRNNLFQLSFWKSLLAPREESMKLSIPLKTFTQSSRETEQ